MMSKLYLITRFAVGGVFLLSVSGKLKDPRSFAHGIDDYEILPETMALGAGLLVIVVEGWLALAHLLGSWMGIAAPLGIGTLGAFAAAVAVNLYRGRALPCYCFDASGGESISSSTLVRLLSLISAEIFLFRYRNTTGLVERVTKLTFAEVLWAIFWATFLLIVFSWVGGSPELAELLRLWDPSEHKTTKKIQGNFSRGAVVNGSSKIATDS